MDGEAGLKANYHKRWARINPHLQSCDKTPLEHEQNPPPHQHPLCAPRAYRLNTATLAAQ